MNCEKNDEIRQEKTIKIEMTVNRIIFEWSTSVRNHISVLSEMILYFSEYKYDFSKHFNLSFCAFNRHFGIFVEKKKTP